jgi:ABC-type uncharacterized transport system auxiliary subunit
MSRVVALAAALLLASCVPALETHRYALAPTHLDSRSARLADGGPVLTVEELEVDAAYDDERMVYRPSAYQLEYYADHLWSATPSLAVSDYLRAAYARSGRFGRVTRSHDGDADVILRGRVTAIEELDVSATKWHGRIALELELENAKTGEVVWSESFSEQVPLVEQHPAALPAAISRALAKIAKRSLAPIAEHALAVRNGAREEPCPTALHTRDEAR